MIGTKQSKWRLALACVLSLGVVGAAQAATTTIRLGWTTSDSAVDPYAIAAHYFQEELEAAAPGQFDVKFFPSNQLGNDKEMLQGMQMGTLDAGVITGTQVGTIEPAFQLTDLPFLFANKQQAHSVLDGDVGQELLQRMEAKGIVGLGFAEAGFRHAINNQRPITKPEEFKGLKLRVQPSSLFLTSFKALGANPVALPWSDAFTAVQQGTVDGLEIPLAVIFANKFAGEVRYLSLTNHTYNALPLLMSKRAFNRLGAEKQAVVKAAARKAIERQRATVEQNELNLLERISAEGMKVNEVADVAAFRDAVKPVYAEYRSSIGAELFDRALGQVTQ